MNPSNFGIAVMLLPTGMGLLWGAAPAVGRGGPGADPRAAVRDLTDRLQRDLLDHLGIERPVRPDADGVR